MEHGGGVAGGGGDTGKVATGVRQEEQQAAGSAAKGRSTGDGASATGGGERDGGAMDVSSLNAEQREAVCSDTGAVLVLAGPGSGKTRVITSRVAWLLLNHKCAPHGVVLVTFTNKAANEMRRRVTQLVGQEQAGGLHMGTFHSIANKFLRRNAEKVDIPSNYSIIDQQDAKRIVKKLMRQHQDAAQFENLAPRTALSYISWAKNLGKSTRELEDMARGRRDKDSYKARVAAAFLNGYQEYLEQSGLLDFDDLLIKYNQLLETHPHTGSFCQHILIDEFQDTNVVQYSIARQLARFGHITVVGDPNQSIYSWRQAQADGYRKFRTDFSDCHVVELSRNYRSTDAIVTVSTLCLNAEEQPEAEARRLWTSNARGPPVVFASYCDPIEEASRIAEQIGKIIKLSKGSVSFKNMAILLRMNAMTRSLEQVFTQVRIPYTIVGGLKFFERAEVRDCMAYLKLCNSTHDNVSLFRIINTPKRGVGPKFLESLEKKAQEWGCSMWDAIVKALRTSGRTNGLRLTGPVRSKLQSLVNIVRRQRRAGRLPSEMLSDILKSIRYEQHLETTDRASKDSRWENVKELLGLTSEFERGRFEPGELSEDPKSSPLAAFLEHISLYATSGKVERKERKEVGQDCVTLCTIHAAKGMEWAVVFVPGVEEETIPHSRVIEESERTHKFDKIEEEQRLLYVAMTRAKFYLHMSQCSIRFSGANSSRIISRFITPAMKGLMKPTVPDGELERTADAVRQMVAPQSEEERAAATAAAEDVLKQVVSHRLATQDRVPVTLEDPMSQMMHTVLHNPRNAPPAMTAFVRGFTAAEFGLQQPPPQQAASRTALSRSRSSPAQHAPVPALSSAPFSASSSSSSSLPTSSPSFLGARPASSGGFGINESAFPRAGCFQTAAQFLQESEAQGNGTEERPTRQWRRQQQQQRTGPMAPAYTGGVFYDSTGIGSGGFVKASAPSLREPQGNNGSRPQGRASGSKAPARRQRGAQQAGAHVQAGTQCKTQHRRGGGGLGNSDKVEDDDLPPTLQVTPHTSASCSFASAAVRKRAKVSQRQVAPKREEVEDITPPHSPVNGNHDGRRHSHRRPAVTSSVILIDDDEEDGAADSVDTAGAQHNQASTKQSPPTRQQPSIKAFFHAKVTKHKL